VVKLRRAGEDVLGPIGLRAKVEMCESARRKVIAMSAAAPARFTVVFDDPELYRRLKVRAAEVGAPVKVLLEQAVRMLLDGGQPAGAQLKEWDWDEWDRWQEEARERDADSAGYARDLSNVKEYLYGREDHPPLRMLAEERTPYGAE
jgi:hypothetical protein